MRDAALYNIHCCQCAWLTQTFRELNGYKNIAFAVFIGGSSHYNWVLSIGEELGQRGHNVTFLTGVSFPCGWFPNIHVYTLEAVVMYFWLGNGNTTW